MDILSVIVGAIGTLIVVGIATAITAAHDRFAEWRQARLDDPEFANRGTKHWELS